MDDAPSKNDSSEPTAAIVTRKRASTLVLKLKPSLSRRDLTQKAREASDELAYLSSPPSSWTVFSAPLRKSISDASKNSPPSTSGAMTPTRSSSLSEWDETTPSRGGSLSSNSADAAEEIRMPRSRALSLESMSPFSYSSPGPSPRDKKAFANASNQKLVVDGSTKLHDLCSSPNPSLEMIRLFVSSFPWSLKQRNGAGNTPLHCAILVDDPIPMVICELLNKWPEGAQVRDKNGDLPLFIAARKKRISVGVLRALINAFPAGAQTKIYGSYALHHLVMHGTASPEAIRLVLNSYPEAAFLPNSHGNLPLHFLYSTLMSNAQHQMEATRMLIKVNPTAITSLNKAGETPIQRALNLSNKYNEEMRERIRLLLRLSDPSILGTEQKQLLRDLNWTARKVIILACVQMVSKLQENDGERGLLHLYSACDGVWRYIIAFL